MHGRQNNPLGSFSTIYEYVELKHLQPSYGRCDGANLLRFIH
ncbi:hypothetical protein ACFOG5_24165 [Pedobacter fastidiosus]